MKLPFDLMYGSYQKPNIYLCETDKTKICRLETIDTKASLKFNSYSEFECTVGRFYEDIIAGEQRVNPFYDKIEALRLLYVEGFGYFEIQDPEIAGDGIKEEKIVNAYSIEYALSQKYIEDFYINTGEINSVEVIYADTHGTNLVPVSFCNISNPELSLVHLILEKVYGWTIGHIDASLMTMSRSFEISRQSVYDFIMQDLCDKFNCFVVFDTIENTINFYAESLITKFIGDGSKTEFIITNPYDSIDTISIDGYKTTAYVYNTDTGVITFDKAPENGAKIEVVDGSQSQWKTDVYVSFDNLVQEVNISYSADDIKTVLTIKGADNLDVREVNFGLPYITDLSYYYNVDWMGQDLYDAYTSYLQKYNNSQNEYTENAKQMSVILDKISYETNRLSLKYSEATVNSATVGKYYVRGGESPNYYYTEVQLPSDYNANTKYYSMDTNDLNEDKFSDFYGAIKTYYHSEDDKDVSELETLKESFSFAETYSIEKLISDLSSANSVSDKDKALSNFLDQLWEQLGLTPLKTLYQTPYKTVEATNIESGWNKEDNENYWLYYPVTIVLSTLDKAIKERETTINGYTREYDTFKQQNNQMTNDILMDVFFKKYFEDKGLTEAQAKDKAKKMLMRLEPFLREDEYTDENFFKTNSDSIDDVMKIKQELLECGRIELAKLCEPKLEFSMSMANIYALREFEPIINQFQLGKLINIKVRNDYIKRARLLEVDINFDDFSDFACTFGELTSLRTQSSIHADLLSSAIQAGKSVASNTSYWNKGSDLATSTDLKIQEGLLDAIEGLYSSTQGVVINKDGIWLTKKDPNTGELSPYQGRIVNNNILYSSDGFKTARTGLGQFTIDGIGTFYGLLAEAVISGYIEGSTIRGGTINIGDGTFVVNSDGAVVMKASSIDGYVQNENIISSINQSAEKITINANKISLAGKAIDLTSDNITISSTNFSVTKDGKITAKEADITGKITASSGAIGGWTIDTNSISGESGSYKALISKGAIGTSGNVVFGVYDGSAWSCYMDGVGKLYASNADIKGKITATSGSIAGYNIGSGGSYTNAIYKRVDGSSADYEVGMKATSGATDLAFYVKESTDNWANSTNTFYIRNNGQLYAQDAVITGEINATSGDIGGCSISNGVLNVDAARITSGTIASARIPNLSADKITAGTINADRIPNISANKITSGTINASNVTITNLDADNITSGTISTNRLSSSVITTSNFSSKTLSTSYLTVKTGCVIGSTTYNVEIGSVGGYARMMANSSSGGIGVTFYDIAAVVAENNSSRNIKSDIHDFDDRYDVFFDNLNPQLFKYNYNADKGYSMGYVWEDTNEALTKANLNREDVGAIYESETLDGGCGLRKTDFIALNTLQIQKLKARVEELENRLAALET